MSIKSKIASLFGTSRQLYNLKKEDILTIEALPRVLNLNIIDSCNSKCTMCNIWRRDEELEISPQDLKKVLSDPLFAELTHVGVTGGEPTLREDLPQIYLTLIEVLPKLKGLSIITNAIVADDVKKSVKKVSEVCLSNNIKFSAMVSIDGVGEMHDKVRGTKGNFESAIQVYNYFKNELCIPVSFGCTISKINVWEVDDLLSYAIKNNMYGRFRIAETINRLYNQNRGQVIRNFDKDESYHLVLFFEKLKRAFEKNQMYQRTYSSIQNMLLGGDRLIGCPYHKNGIVLGSKGQINYCAPKSDDIGNGLEVSALEIYRSNFSKKEAIIANDCKKCIHDYHAPITYFEKKSELKTSLHSKLLRIEHMRKLLALSRFLKSVKKDKSMFRLFIVGWYGTETVGDKAILGGIIEDYTSRFGNKLEIVIGSLYPFITERTCHELGVKAKVVSSKTMDLLRYAKSSDEVVMGGGPLMDLEDLYVPLISFRIAKLYGNTTVVKGCGIGPVYAKKNEVIIEEVLRRSDKIELRDNKSLDVARAWGFSGASLSGDYAKNYIENNYRSENLNLEQNDVLTCYLREWTYEYSRDLTREEFLVLKESFETGIAKLIRNKAKELGVKKIRLDHMHNFVVGKDDRDFSRYFIEKYFADEQELEVSFNRKLSTVDSIVEEMKRSKFNICMRFHSVLFAQTLGVQFLAIDYTKGGKIRNFLQDNGAISNMLTIDDVVG